MEIWLAGQKVYTQGASSSAWSDLEGDILDIETGPDAIQVWDFGKS